MSAVALTAAAGFLAAVDGCATTPPPLRPTAQPQYPIAVRYDVEPVIAEHGVAEGLDAFRRDVDVVAQIGFNSIMLRQMDERDKTPALNIAHERNLHVWLPSRARQRAIATSSLDHEPRSVEAEANQTSTKASTTNVTRIVDATGHRLDPAFRIDPAWAIVGGKIGTSAPFVTVRIGIVNHAAEAPPVETLLAQYHAGIARGETGGLMVDRFRRPPGGRPDLANTTHRWGPALPAAVKTLVARAKAWGPRIFRAKARPVPNASSMSSDLTVAVLQRGAIRYLLVSNQSSSKFARASVLLPQVVEGTEPHRAVEIPSAPNVPVGRVHDAQRGRLTLPVSLRPGDATLFELFSNPSQAIK